MHVNGEDPMFSGVNKKKPLEVNGRTRYRRNYERITVWEMSADPICYPTVDYEAIQRTREETTDFHERIGSAFVRPPRRRAVKLQAKREGATETELRQGQPYYQMTECGRCHVKVRNGFMAQHKRDHCELHKCYFCQQPFTRALLVGHARLCTANAVNRTCCGRMYGSRKSMLTHRSKTRCQRGA